jgi:hypothetical protein
MSNAYPPYDPANPYSSQQFGNGPNNTFPNDDSQKSGKSGCLWGCLIGGVVGFLVVVLACGIGAWYLTVNAKPLIAGAARNVAVQMVEASELSAEDKTQVVGQIDRVVNAYKKGEINEEDLQRILKEVERSPLLPMAVVFGVEVQYLERSGLSAEEKEDARLQLQRIARGGFEQKIDNAKLDALMEPLLVKVPNGEKRLKDQITDEELRKFFAAAKQLADESMIPNEKFQIDIGDEVTRIVDRALSEKEKP